MNDRKAAFKYADLVFIEQRDPRVPATEKIIIRNLANKTEIKMSLDEWTVVASQAQYIRARAR